jgi:hypothetical protein
MRARRVPLALREVWEWKEACYREVKHLPVRQALVQRLDMATKRAAELGFPTGGEERRLEVAEETPPYGSRRRTPRNSRAKGT